MGKLIEDTRTTPYIGVCDVYNPLEARVMADELRAHRTNTSRKLMVGVMAHPLSLNPGKGRGIPECDKVREVFPDRRNLADAFTDDPDVVNTIHYADLYGPNAGKNVYENLELCVQHGGKNLHAIQLDLTWPDASEIARFKQAHSHNLILQVGKKAMEEAGNDPRKVAEKLREYKDSIDYALFDSSMGKGKLMEADKILSFLRQAKEKLPYLNLSVAGGLGPESARGLLEPIGREFPTISIDAQGNLKGAYVPKDALGHFVATYAADLDKSCKYIREGCKILDGRA